MTVELNEEERALLLVVLGMAMGTATREDAAAVDGKFGRGIRRLMGKIAPASYWALPPDD